MKVSAKAKYACVAMMELAGQHARGQPVSIQTIADAQGISPRFLVQILLQLKTGGLVASVRGASGGYQLARPPEQISLAAILNAIEDRTRVPRSEQENLSSSAAARTLVNVWKELEAEEQRFLEEISLAELVRRSRETATLSYQI